MVPSARSKWARYNLPRLIVSECVSCVHSIAAISSMVIQGPAEIEMGKLIECLPPGLPLSQWLIHSGFWKEIFEYIRIIGCLNVAIWVYLYASVDLCHFKERNRLVLQFKPQPRHAKHLWGVASIANWKPRPSEWDGQTRRHIITCTFRKPCGNLT